MEYKWFKLEVDVAFLHRSVLIQCFFLGRAIFYSNDRGNVDHSPLWWGLGGHVTPVTIGSPSFCCLYPTIMYKSSNQMAAEVWLLNLCKQDKSPCTGASGIEAFLSIQIGQHWKYRRIYAALSAQVHLTKHSRFVSHKTGYTISHHLLTEGERSLGQTRDVTEFRVLVQ